MNEHEYKQFLEYIFNEYVGGRLHRLEEFYDHPRLRSKGYDLHGLKRAAVIIRFITENYDGSDDIYRISKVEAVCDVIRQVEVGVRRNNRLLRQTGLMDAFDSYFEEIMEGVRLEYFPDYDIELLQSFGSPNPKAELQGIVVVVKHRKNRRASYNQEVSISMQLERVEKELATVREQLDNVLEKKENAPEPPKKSRRWWKGMGQICTGAAISIADIALTVGALPYQVSP